MRVKTTGGLAVGIAATAFLGACKKGDDASRTGPSTVTASGAVVGDMAAVNSGVSAGAMNDAGIFYILDAANMRDSATGALAATKGTSAEVRDLAKTLLRDHHALRQQGLDLAKRLAITPTPPSGNNYPVKLDSILSTLAAAAKGRDFDKAYVDQEVGAHRKMLTNLTEFMRATHNSEIKYLIQKAAPVVQAHLDNAQAVQKNLQQ